MNKEAELNAVRWEILVKDKSSFYSTAFFMCNFRWDDSHPTAYSAGRVIGFSPDFWAKLNKDERVFVCLHEVLHFISEHADRGKLKVHTVYNKAADYWINDVLINAGFKMPNGGLHDTKFSNHDTDAIYDILIKEYVDGPEEFETNHKNVLEDDIKDVLDINGKPVQGGSGNEEAKQLSREFVQDIITQMQVGDKMSGIGDLPASLQRLVQSIVDPQIPWEDELAHLLYSMDASDYSFEEPDYDTPDSEVILPSLLSDGLGSVRAYIDISGSVTEAMHSKMVSELGHLKTRMMPEHLAIINFYTELKELYEFTKYEELEDVQYYGGGGTSIVPVYEDINKHDPQIAIIFTDGDFYLHEELLEPIENLIWVIFDSKNFEHEQGTVLYYDAARY